MRFHVTQPKCSGHPPRITQPDKDHSLWLIRLDEVSIHVNAEFEMGGVPQRLVSFEQLRIILGTPKEQLGENDRSAAGEICCQRSPTLALGAAVHWRSFVKIALRGLFGWTGASASVPRRFAWIDAHHDKLWRSRIRVQREVVKEMVSLAQFCMFCGISANGIDI
jgi:hypothetical protein